MDIVWRAGSATSSEIRAQLSDPPVPAAVRTLLRILEEKGQLRHTKESQHHVYSPVLPRKVAQKSAIKHLIGTFFDGSRSAAVAALIDESERPLSDAEREELTAMIKRLRASGK